MRVAPVTGVRGPNRPGGLKLADLRLSRGEEPALTVADGGRGAAHVCDGVFDGECDAEVYSCVGTPLVESALKGGASCVIGYGQSGSGKSYNMWRVLLPAMTEALFKAVPPFPLVALLP